MTREDIDSIISIICPNDEDFEKPIISPAYLKNELEALALDQEPCENCCNGNQIEKAKLCQKSYIAGMEHKQEPCEDAISRQAVLELVADYDLSMGQVVKGIHALPSVTPMPKWIPVSERLPEVGSEVLVCYEFKKQRSVYIANFYGDGKFHGLDDEYLTTEGRKYRKAVAWMPLPQPYTAENPIGAEGSDKK